MDSPYFNRNFPQLLPYNKQGKSAVSGGFFDYNQYRIKLIAEELDSLIEKNNFKCKDHPRCEESYYSCECGRDLPDEVIAEFKKASKALKVAHVYAQRVDWLLSGDDGEESFFRRLKEDLAKL
jgi:hypothetical protein